jgi:ubiquinone/menaquinone biosynthesis C-methylase UbiE
MTTPNVDNQRISQALFAFTRSQLVFAAVNLGVFTAIHRGADTVQDLTATLGADRRGMTLLLDGLVGIGFLRKTSGPRYSLPEDVATYLVEDSPHFLGGMVRHCQSLSESWALLADVVRTGEPAGSAQGMAEIETRFAELVQGLYVGNMPLAQTLARELGIGAPECSGLQIVDIAGGSAVFAIALLEADPASRATVIDYPSVVQVAQRYVARHDLSDRFDYIPGDLEVMPLPENAFDLAVMANICHALSPDANAQLIASVAKSLRTSGRLAIVELLPDNDRSQPGWPLIFGVNMLVCTQEGNVYTPAEYDSWLAGAGLRTQRIIQLSDHSQAIVAGKA